MGGLCLWEGDRAASASTARISGYLAAMGDLLLCSLPAASSHLLHPGGDLCCSLGGNLGIIMGGRAGWGI